MPAVLNRIIVATLLWGTLAAAAAQAEPAERARAATQMLDAAQARLAQADTGRDRVRALTATVSAYEEGLAALRSGLRQVSQREDTLLRELQSKELEIASLLGALQRVGGNASPVFLLHPGGPTGTVRAGMLLAEVVPALDAKADILRRDYVELQALQALQETSAARLTEGLQEVQAARSALNQAISDRTDLPQKFTADPVREAILVSTAETLDAFAAGLDQIALDGLVIAAPDSVQLSKGDLALPVRGRIRYAAGERDAAGVARPGIVVETLPSALVTSPARATLRYAGPLLDFGTVVILEPQADVLFVLAGLATVYAETGDVMEEGAPLGLMGDASHKSAASFSTDSEQTGAARTETLYIEIRDKNKPVDPAQWFRSDKDG